MNVTEEMRGNERGVLILAALAVLAVALVFWPLPSTEAQPPRIRDFVCGADNIGATLTIMSAQDPLTGAVSGNCSAVEDGMTRYITDIIATSTTATAGEFLLRSGTGTNCGTGTQSLLPFTASTNVRMGLASNLVSPTVIQPKTPIRVPEGKDLCVIGIATQTFSGEVRGYIGPK